MPNSSSGIAIINDAEYEVVNRGNRPVDIQKGVFIEQRTKGLSGMKGNIFSQTILAGSTGTLEPGESRTFLVRFRAPSPLPFHGGGFAEWEFRAVCEAAPAELHLKLIKWLQQQTWSPYLPRALLAKEINSYAYFSAWTPVRKNQELSPSGPL